MNQQPLIILAGPTSVGKTKLSIQLAKQIGGEIISADSMQVYRYMDIGSAKITKEEQQGIPHYLIDILDPTDAFDIVSFQARTKEAIRCINHNGHIPIIVGGTGFYIQSVLYDIDFTETEELSDYRLELQEIADKNGNVFLHQMLKEVDEASASAIHPNNRKRVIRALEFYKQSGSRISDHNEMQRQKEPQYPFVYFVLNDDRDVLYQRIENRVDKMIQDGLVEECRKLKEMGCSSDMVSMQGLGYKEILSYLNGNLSLEDAISLTKKNTRHFAKRQLTWFHRENDITWVNRPHFQSEKEIENYLVQKSIECIRNGKGKI